jgi:hypothetical protein
MNASSIEDATEIDYFITNVKPSKVTLGLWTKRKIG